MKKKLVVTGILGFLVYMFLFPAEALLASRNGLLLWMHSILPTLLPFMILSNIFIGINAIEPLLNPFRFLWERLFGLTPNGAYALLLGMLCGYPMGVKLTCELFKKKKISRFEADYLLTFSNNASPMFITNYIVLECLQRPDYLPFTFLILYSGNYLCSICFRWYYKQKKEQELCIQNQENLCTEVRAGFGDIIDHSIMNSFEAVTKLGGYIVLFSIAASCVQIIFGSTSLVSLFILGILEMTTGIRTLTQVSLPFPVIYTGVLTIAAFGGWSVLAQTKSIINNSGLSIRCYLISKICNACVTASLCVLVFQFV